MQLDMAQSIVESRKKVIVFTQFREMGDMLVRFITDRAYRIGQHKNVQVRRFITQNTFEEKIDRMIQEKRYLAELTVASGENWIGKLSNKELRELFG